MHMLIHTHNRSYLAPLRDSTAADIQKAIEDVIGYSGNAAVAHGKFCIYHRMHENGEGPYSCAGYVDWPDEQAALSA